MKGDFSAYKLPVGSEFVLGKRRWRLVERQDHHPDFMTFRETSEGAHTPDRVFNPSEIEALYNLGIVFMVPMQRREKGDARDRDPEVLRGCLYGAAQEIRALATREEDGK